MLNDLRNMSTIRREAVLMNELADERHQEDEDEDSFLN
jgi:hypothetical protein